MEIIEIVSSRIDLEKNLLEVSFRTIDDSDDEIREDKIDYNLVEEYGYTIEDESFDFFVFVHVVAFSLSHLANIPPH